MMNQHKPTWQLIRAFALMLLMMTTSLVAHASYQLRGDYSTDGSGWSNTGIVFQDITGTNQVYVDYTVNANFQFKIVNQYDGNTVWIGGEGTASQFPHTFQLTEGGGNNMTIAVAGTYRFTYDYFNHTLTVGPVPPAPCPVVVKSPLTNGTVTVDKATASAGETVTITVTPADGYYAESIDITAETTINPGNANAPRRAPSVPSVGQKLTVSGDAVATATEPGTYTFVMPDFPLGVEVSAEFHQCTEITADMFEEIGDQAWTGGKIMPFVHVATGSGLTENDYEVTYGDNVTGTGTVTITGKGKYTGTVTLNFNIVRPSLYLIGSFNSWNESEGLLKLEEQQDGTFKVSVTNWPANSEFKLVDDQSIKLWYGADQSENDGPYELNKDRINVAQLLKTASGAANFKLPVPGDWTFTVSADWKHLTVTGTWKYAIGTYVTDGVGGTVAATPNPAAAGEEVTLTLTPNEGYELANVTVRTSGDNPTNITVTDNKFTMPESNVDVWATFTKIPTLTLRYSTDGWANTTDVAFTKDATTGNWTLSKPAGELWPAGMSFKLIDQDGTWHGANEAKSEGNENYWLTKGKIGVAQDMRTGSNAMNYYLPVTGNWTFTVTEDAVYKYLTVAGDWDHTITIDAPAALAAHAEVNHASVGGEDALVTETRAAAGETVQMVFTAPAHSIVTITVMDAAGNTYLFDVNNKSFVMPYTDVTVKMTYVVETYAITLSGMGSDAQGYTLATDQNNNAAVPVGTPVTVTVTPNNENDFVAVGLVTDPEVEVTDNGDGTYTFIMPASNINVSATVEAKLHGVVFDENRHWATYYFDANYSLKTPEGVTVYIPTGVTDGVMQVEEYTYGIPRGQAVLLYSETPMSNITTPTIPVAPGAEGTGTILTGVTEDTGLLAGQYVLYNDVFVRSEAGTLPAHRAYLHLDNPAGAPRMLRIALPNDGGIVTGVDGIEASDVVSVKYVNLHGMTSDKPFSGVNVMVITRTDGTTQTMKVIK